MMNWPASAFFGDQRRINHHQLYLRAEHLFLQDFVHCSTISLRSDVTSFGLTIIASTCRNEKHFNVAFVIKLSIFCVQLPFIVNAAQVL